MKIRAFTLYEVLIVVALLGVLAAVVLPTYQGYAVSARESAVKDCLMTMRTQIEFYRMQHNGVLPGYANGNPVSEFFLKFQFIGTTTVAGAVNPSTVPTTPYLYGPYVKKLPVNPFNNLSNITYVAEGTLFSAVVDGTTSGWLYKKETGDFVINWVGTDSEGVNFYDY